MPLPSVPNPETTVTINDFSPGIYSVDASTTLTPVSGQYPPAPLGAAQEQNTWGCMAMPGGGGLCPLPRSGIYGEMTIGAGETLVPIAGIGASYGINQQIIMHREAPAPPRYFAFNVPTGGGVLVLDTWRNLAAGVTGHALSDTSGASTPYGIDLNRGVTLSGAVGQLKTAHILAGRAHVPNGAAMNYFFEWNRASTSWEAKVAYSAFGEAFGHGQRNNFWSGIADCARLYYDNDSGALQGELILDGFLGGNTYGVISTGEFLMISKGGGALRISGSFEYPTITELPGVVSTGKQSMRAVPCSAGLLYCVDGVGVYAWNGSNTSKFVSPQLRYNFFERATPTSDSSGGQTVQACKWGAWAVFPNGFVFNPELNSWWRLPGLIADVGDDYPAVFFSDQDDVLYAMLDTLTSATEDFAVLTYDRRNPTDYYTWQSQPIPVGSHGKMVEVNDIEIRVAPGSLNAQRVMVTLTGVGGTTTTETFNFTPTTLQPIRLRKSTSCKGYDVTVRVESRNLIDTAGAPVLHAVSLSWIETSPVGGVL